ncbi:MAG: RnfABCDGE type electron transport complex subunit A [Anaerovoracaceae bacterium]|nr:RnfABCDGE type electron transport complex subunit A [Bacillota bacterium]MDY2671473.1 RnfABCDGE type electron transport complex subunit A [Anaerovoracaceae bacterium]
MAQYLSIMLTVMIVSNYVLAQFLGICPFLGVSKKLDSAVGMSVAVTFVMVLATVVTWPIQRLILDPLKIGYLQTVVFILVIAALVQLVELILKKYVPSLYTSLGIYLPLITTNCAVLGVTVNNIQNDFTFGESLCNSFGAGVGFLIAMVIFAGVRGKMESADIPEGLKGIPITLMAASVLSVSFMGFSGVIEGIFS